MKRATQRLAKTNPALRARAEAAARGLHRDIRNLSAAEVRRLAHELQVHQIELEMQNEELRQAQTELAQSRDRLTELYDLAPVGYVTIDGASTIFEANLTAASMLRLPRQRLLGRKLQSFAATESRDTLYLHYLQVQANPKPHAFDLVLRRADGTTFPAHLKGSPVTDGNGAFRCHAALVDMTALRAAEAALRANVQQYRLLFELNPCPMLICDERTLRFLDVNEAALQLYGYSREAFLHLDARDIRPPEDVPDFLRLARSLRNSQSTPVGEWRHRKRDGTVFPVAVSVSSIQYGGRPANLVLVTDITERRAAEAALNELNASLEGHVNQRTAELSDANRRLRAIMDNSAFGILTFDEQGLIEFLNPAAVRMFGCEAADVLGKNVSQLLAAADQPPDTPFLEHYLAGGGNPFLGAQRQVLGRRNDGSAFLAELSLAGFTQGRRRQFVVMVRDVTARSRLERELLDVGDRERQRLGHELHDSLGQQMHGLHYLATLFEKDLRRESPGLACQAARLRKYLEQALELMRSLARGLQPVTPVPEGLLRALGELAQRTRELFGLDCRFECPKSVLIQRVAAANHLFRIAQEAVNNAVKHGRPTRIRIKLSASPEAIVLGVRDNGVGFKPKRRHDGKGMGLHVMQYRADAIHGSLLVQRRSRGGTEVVCTVRRQALLKSIDPIK